MTTAVEGDQITERERRLLRALFPFAMWSRSNPWAGTQWESDWDRLNFGSSNPKVLIGESPIYQSDFLRAREAYEQATSSPVSPR